MTTLWQKSAHDVTEVREQVMFAAIRISPRNGGRCWTCSTGSSKDHACWSARPASKRFRRRKRLCKGKPWRNTVRLSPISPTRLTDVFFHARPNLPTIARLNCFRQAVNLKIKWILVSTKIVLMHFLCQLECVAMTQHPDVWSQRFAWSIFLKPFQHSSFRRSSQYSMPREMNPAQEINARSKCLDQQFIWMEWKL